MVQKNQQATTLLHSVALLWDKTLLRLRMRREQQLYLFDTKPYELRCFYGVKLR
jgi:hypothetical protein